MTTADDVKVIIDTSLTDPVIEGYIAGADVFLLDALSSSMPEDDLFNEIERWVVAHMIATTKERAAKKEEAGGAKIEYSGTFGAGFESTSYGQMAMMLDGSGALAVLNGKKKRAYLKSVPNT